MNIRYKITLWVTGAGLITSLMLCLVVFMEMREQPLEIIDSQLKASAESVVRQITLAQKSLEDKKDAVMLISSWHYWLKIYDHNLHVVYQSNMSGIVDIPLYIYNGEKTYNFNTYIPRERIDLHQDDEDEVTFRVRTFAKTISGLQYLIQIARPMEDLEEEGFDLLASIGTGLAVSTLLLVFLSYVLAGRIVRPISKINSLSREINEKTLEKRIPLGKSRDEIYELSESLNRMFDRLQLSFSTQKEFLASASHELKSPSAMLRLFFEESAQRLDLPEAFRRELMQQGGNALRMERLSKALLELSALELAPFLEIELFHLTQLMEGLLEDFSVVFRANNMMVRLNSPKNLMLAGDKNKIRRLLINLIDNAVKYNNEKGEIEIVAGMESGAVQIAVFNTGPGIPADELEKVFDQFHRVEKSRSVQYGGAGLGLAIARQIVSLHGGRIWIESKPGEWTRVHVVLPHATL